VKRNFDSPVMVGVVLLVALLVLIPALTYRNIRQLNEDARGIVHTHEVLDFTGDVLLALVDAETGQRGFLVTGKDIFLEPYDAALARLDGLVVKLKDKTKDDPGQQARITKLQEMIVVRMGFLRESIDLRRTNAEEALALVATGKGKAQMNAIRQHVAEMKQVEGDLLKDRESKSAAAYRVAVASGLVTAVLGLLAVGGFVWLLRRSLSARQKAADVIADQGERLRTTLASIGDAVITTDLDGRVTNMNAVGEALTKWTTTEAMGQPLDAVFRIVNETSRKTVENPVTRALREGVIVGLANHTVLIGKDGTERPIDDSAAPIRCKDGEVVGCVLVFRDITERKRDEVALAAAFRESADLKAALDEHAIVATTDAQGKITFVNDKFCAISKYPREELLGQDHRIINSGHHPKAFFRDLWSTIAQGRPWHGEIKNKAKDGSYYWVETTIVPLLNEEGKPAQYVAIRTEITARKEAEEKLRQIAADLSESDRRKGEFLAMLSHELRNPLAPIRNMLQVIKLKGDDKNAVANASQVIERQVGQMVRLVDDLLDISRLSRGKIELRKERIDLASIIQQAEEAASPHCQNMNHELTVTLPSRPVEVNGDPVRLIQVVSNLLTNACKFTDAGGRIWLSVERVGEDVGEGVAEQAVIRVRDNGMGISAANLPRLFQIFMQADTSIDRPFGGLGIGLALVKNLVEMHGGTVQVQSEGIGRGSEFVVRLPALPAESQAPPPEPTSTNRTEDATDPKPSLRILVVDDNRDSANSMAMLLEYDGHTTHTAYDGLEAVEAVDTFRPDVVLLDIGLPTLNGYEACRRIREQASDQTIRLIALTGWGQDEDRKKTAEAGFDAHLVKPVDYDQLLKLLA